MSSLEDIINYYVYGRSISESELNNLITQRYYYLNRNTNKENIPEYVTIHRFFFDSAYTCTICMENYGPKKSMKINSCYHNWCVLCDTKIKKECPLCRKEFSGNRIEIESHDFFEKNYVYSYEHNLQIVEILKIIQKDLEKINGVEGEEEEENLKKLNDEYNEYNVNELNQID